MYPPIQNGMVIGADAEIERRYDEQAREDRETDCEIDHLMTLDEEVEEALVQNIDVVRASLRRIEAEPAAAGAIVAEVNRMIRTHLEPIARYRVQRSRL